MDYLYDYNTEFHKKLVDHKIDLKEKLSYLIVSDGYLLPAKVSEKTLFGLGGVLNSNNESLTESYNFSGAKFTSKVKKSESEIYFGGYYKFSENPSILNEEVVYLGYINNHWGHFLVDFSTRLWIINKLGTKKTKYVFLVNENENFKPSTMIIQFLEMCGLPIEKVEFINSVTRYKKIIIPEISYATNMYYSKEYLQLFKSIVKNCDFTDSKYKNKRIYLTRTNFYKAQKTEFGEKQIEEAFQDNGFQVLSPEDLTLIDQIMIFNGNNLIVCMSGTIGHNLMFSQDNTELIILNKTYNYNMVQRDINAITNSKVKYIDCYLAPFPVTLGFGPFILIFNENLIKFFEERGYSISNKIHNNNRIYIKHFMIKYVSKINTNLIIYPKNKNLNNYYNIEHLEYFMKNYYFELHPISYFDRLIIMIKEFILLSKKFKISKILMK